MSSPDIVMKPIGIIHTPFRDTSDGIPIQGRLGPDTEGSVEIFPAYRDACRDIGGFSHILLLYHFHASGEERTVTRSYLDTEERGVFSTRSPHRPNHIGLTLVRLTGISPGRLSVRGVDMLDGTPLLDIKPYTPRFDATREGEELRTGWLEYLPEDSLSGPAATVRSREQWLQKQAQETKQKQ